MELPKWTNVNRVVLSVPPSFAAAEVFFSILQRYTTKQQSFFERLPGTPYVTIQHCSLDYLYACTSNIIKKKTKIEQSREKSGSGFIKHGIEQLRNKPEMLSGS